MVAGNHATFMEERQIGVRPAGEPDVQLLKRLERGSGESSLRAARPAGDPGDLAVIGAEQHDDHIRFAVGSGPEHESLGTDVLHRELRF